MMRLLFILLFISGTASAQRSMLFPLLSRSSVAHTTTAPQPPAGPKYVLEQQCDSCAFSPRDGAELAWYGGKLHLTGGWDGALTPPSKNEDWTSEDSGKTWTLSDSGMWNLPRHTFVNQVLNDTLYVALCDVYNKTDQSVYRYTKTGGWQLVTANLGMPDNQTLYAQCVHTDSTGKAWIYIAGGQWGADPQFGDKWNNYVYRYDGHNLEKVADLPDTICGNRSNGVLYSYHDTLYFGSGGEYWSNGNHTYKADMWRSVDDGGTWAQLPDTFAFLACQYGDGAVWDDHMWFVAGANKNVGGANGNMSGIYYTDDWITIHTLADDMVPSHARAVCVAPDGLHIAAGNATLVTGVTTSWRIKTSN